MAREYLQLARTVLEYGSGGSSFLALDLGVEFLVSVESDADFATRIEAALSRRFDAGRFRIHRADIGVTGKWGAPTGKANAGLFHRYATTVWTRPDFRQPDVVLIDGRFRAACAITTMLLTRGPVTILFDDYFNRPHYHWIEDHMQPVDRADRVAVFQIGPTDLPRDDLVRILAAYQDPR